MNVIKFNSLICVFMEDLEDPRDVMLVLDSLIHYSFKLNRAFKDCSYNLKDYYEDRFNRIYNLVDFLSKKL